MNKKQDHQKTTSQTATLFKSCWPCCVFVAQCVLFPRYFMRWVPCLLLSDRCLFFVCLVDMFPFSVLRFAVVFVFLLYALWFTLFAVCPVAFCFVAFSVLSFGLKACLLLCAVPCCFMHLAFCWLFAGFCLLWIQEIVLTAQVIPTSPEIGSQVVCTLILRT